MSSDRTSEPCRWSMDSAVREGGEGVMGWRSWWAGLAQGMAKRWARRGMMCFTWQACRQCRRTAFYPEGMDPLCDDCRKRR